jgi:hypothetical protein
MDLFQPRVRRRGFLVGQDTGEPEDGHDSAEGITFRVRIVRPKFRRPAVVSLNKQSSPARRHSSPDYHATHDTSAPPGRIKSANETGTHRQARTRR